MARFLQRLLNRLVKFLESRISSEDRRDIDRMVLTSMLAEALDGLEELSWLPPDDPVYRRQLMWAMMLHHQKAERFPEHGDVEVFVSLAEKLQAAGEHSDEAAVAALRVTLAHARSGVDAQQLRADIAALERRYGTDHGEASAVASLIATAYQKLYSETGSAGAMEEAITWSYRQLEGGFEHDRDRAQALMQVAFLRRARFTHFGDVRDLDAAIAACTQAVAATSAEEAAQVRYRANLALALADRALLAPDPGPGLDEVIEQLDGVSADAHRLRLPTEFADNSLAQLLADRFERTGGRADIDRAVELTVGAAECMDTGDPLYSTVLTNSATVYTRRYERYRDEGDLDAAIDWSRRAWTAAPQGTPAFAQAVINGAGLLARRCFLAMDRWDPVQPGDPTADSADFAEAESLLLRALQVDVSPVARCHLSVLLGRHRLLAKRWDQAHTHYQEAIGLLPVLATRRIPLTDRFQQLTTFDGIAREAAAVMLWAADVAAGTDPPAAHRLLREATVLLDQGRNVLIGQVLDPDSDLQRLHRAHPELAGEYAELSAQLAGVMVDADLQRRLADRWYALVAQIRSHDSFDGFLAPPGFPELASAAAAGPVAVVNVADRRCDAIVIRPDATVTVVPLTGVTPARVAAQVRRWTGQIGVDDPDRQAMSEVLRWCWTEVMAPLVDALGIPELPGADERVLPSRRLWIVPTGQLSLLPLHAAGGPGGGMFDRDVVVSYAPTLLLLARAAARREQPWRRQDTVGVAMVHTPGEAPLPAAEREVALAAESRLCGADATCDAVRDALATARFAHLSCHAWADPWDPAGGALLLHDGRLLFTDISARRHHGGQAVVLSGCGTALPSGRAKHTDEPLSIAAAFQASGFAHAVGTLWAVPDNVALRVTENYYAALRDGLGIAYALHRAVRAVRRRYTADPRMWAAYVHFGP